MEVFEGGAAAKLSELDMRLGFGVIYLLVGDVVFGNAEDEVRRYVNMDMYLVMRANVKILAIVERVFGFCAKGGSRRASWSPVIRRCNNKRIERATNTRRSSPKTPFGEFPFPAIFGISSQC